MFSGQTILRQDTYDINKPPIIIPQITYWKWKHFEFASSITTGPVREQYEMDSMESDLQEAE